MKKRDHLKPGYKAFNGYIFKEMDCKKYNAIQDRINAFIDAKMPVSETLLNESYIMFKSIIGVL